MKGRALAAVVLMAACAPAAIATETGYMWGSDCNTTNGWAWDDALPNTPISVDVYDGAAYVQSVMADRFDQRLVNEGRARSSIVRIHA